MPYYSNKVLSSADAVIEKGIKLEKKQKLQDVSRSLAIGLTWEWLDDGNVWTAFSKACVNLINDAFTKGQKEV